MILMLFEWLKSLSDSVVPEGNFVGMGYSSIVYSILVILSSFILAKLTYFLLKTFVAGIVEKTRTKVDDEILVIIEKPMYYLIILIGVSYGLEVFIPEYLIKAFKIIFYSAIVLILTKVATDISKIFISHTIEKKTPNRDISNLLKRLIRIFIVVFGFIAILSFAGIEITPLLASLGVAGLAVALALQETLANFFAGVYIILDKTFRLGDVIQLPTGEMGRVEKIGTRSTRIKTFDNTIITMPNNELAKAKVINLSAADEIIRTKIPIGVSYDSDPEKVKNLLEKIAKSQKTVIKDSVVARFLSFGDSALQFELHYKTKLHDRMSTLDAVNTQIIKEFRKAGIDIPFPIRTVYLEK